MSFYRGEKGRRKERGVGVGRERETMFHSTWGTKQMAPVAILYGVYDQSPVSNGSARLPRGPDEYSTCQIFDKCHI